MGNKNDAKIRRKSGQMKFKTRSFKGNKYTSSLLNTSTITVESASTKKIKSNITSTLPSTTAEVNAFHSGQPVVFSCVDNF